MAKANKLAGRYAKAFVEYLGTDEKIRSAIVDLQFFSKTLSENAELASALLSDVAPVSQRLAVVGDVADRLSLKDGSKRLLGVLASKKRLVLLAEVTEGMRQNMLALAGITSLVVESASELTSDEKKLVEEKFTQVLGKKVEATYKVSVRILGGVRVTAGSRTFDGSISAGLTRLEEKLIGGSI